MVHGLGGPLLVLSERCVWGLNDFNEGAGWVFSC